MSNEVKKKSKNSKKQQQQKEQISEDDYRKLTKDEEAVAKYLKFNCPTKKASLGGMKVDYFIGSKAVDFLMNSKFATGAKNQPVLFTSRESCKPFLQELLNKELFHRAVKVYKEQSSSEPAAAAAVSKNNETTPENTPVTRKRKSDKVESTGTPTATPVPTNVSNEDKASKRKFKLDMHDNQVFLDSSDAYVWIYDPTTTKTMIVGFLLVIGAIGVCLFPLWPSIVREGVYYVSLAGAGFLGFILGLAVLKYILFAFVFIATFGSIRFWLLPNLTEDVGFFESFQPVYKINNNKNNNKGNKTTTTASKKIEESKNDDKKQESTTTTATSAAITTEEFNKLPLDEQLMKKFDENISDNDDNVDEEDYDVIEKDVDLKNN